MKKTFQLHVEGKHPDRVMDAAKHDIRKYVKRQRRVALPEGVDFWDFDCRFGLNEESAEPAHLATLTSLMDAASKDGAKQVYVELVAKAGVRTQRPRQAGDADSAQAIDADEGDDD
jgi:hypothetical protein